MDDESNITSSKNEAELTRIWSLKRRLVLNSAASGLAQIVHLFSLVWVIQHLMARVPPDQIAILAVAQSLAWLLPVILEAFSAGIARFVAEAHVSGEMSRVVRIVSTMVAVNSAAAAVIGVAMLIAVWQIDFIINVEPQNLQLIQWTILFLIGPSIIGLPFLPLTTGMYVRQNFIMLGMITVIVSLVRSALLLALILGIGPQIVLLAVATFVSEIIGLVAKVLASLRLLPEACFSWRSICLPQILPVLSFGLWSTLGRTAESIRVAAGPLILNHLSSPNEVGAFYVGSTLDRNTRALVSVLISPLEPALLELHAKGDVQRLRAVFLKSITRALWLTAPPILVMLALREDLLRVYLGDALDQYGSTSAVVGLLLLAIPFVVVLNVIYFLCRASNQVGPFTRAAVTTQLLTILLSLALVGNMTQGAIGASLAAAVGAVTSPATFWHLPGRAAGITRAAIAVAAIRGLAPAALAAATAGTLLYFLNSPSTFVILLVACGCTGLGYLLSLIFSERTIKPSSPSWSENSAERNFK